jgi:hypothetical protein
MSSHSSRGLPTSCQKRPNTRETNSTPDLSGNDDAVSAFFLGSIQSHVGNTEQSFPRCAVLGVGGNPDGYGHFIEHLSALLHLCISNRLSQLLGAFADNPYRRIGKNECEFLASVSTGDIVRTELSSKDPCNFSEYSIACLVTKGVVETLKVINVNHHDRVLKSGLVDGL